MATKASSITTCDNSNITIDSLLKQKDDYNGFTSHGPKPGGFQNRIAF